MRERPRPRYPLLSDSSSCGGDDNSDHGGPDDLIVVATERVERLDLDGGGGGEKKGKSRETSQRPAVAARNSNEPEDRTDGAGTEKGNKADVAGKKRSFWQKLLGGGKKSKESSS